MSENKSENKKEERGKISRRDFLKDAGLIVGGAVIGSTTLLAACGSKEAVETKTVTKYVCPIDQVEFSAFAELQAHFAVAHPEVSAPTFEELIGLTINGLAYELRVEPNWTLAFVLREKLGFMGVKIGCDEGACGACTVLMDGKPILSCTMLAIECAGRVLETIEGLAPDAVTLHPIQQAFIENHGMQCGYCTPGMILVTKALLGRNPNPSEQEVRQALAGNICRCGDYQQILASVLAAAAK